jgi:hypothetical protein
MFLRGRGDGLLGRYGGRRRGHHRSHLGKCRRGNLPRKSQVGGLSHIQVEGVWEFIRFCGALTRIGVSLYQKVLC